MGNLQFKTFLTITKNESLDDDQWTVTNFHSQNFFKNYDSITRVIVLSSFAVTKGVYFYEIELLQGIEIQVGWTTRLVEISKTNQFFVKNTQLAILKTQNSSTNDIFGCFVNIEQKIINFYYNGQLKKVEYDKDIFNYKPIFAVALVSYKHAIQVNFGQTKFKYPPNENYNTFHSASIKNFPKNSLTQIQTKNNIEWFCEKNFKNRFKLLVFEYENYQNDQKDLLISLFHYCDSEQILFNQTIIKIETMINEGYQYEVIKNFIIAFLNSNFKNNFYRFLQSIIEVIGYKIESNKISKLDYCIILIYNECFKRLKKLKISLFESALTNHTFFASYFFNFLKSITGIVKNQIKTHYICLILIYKINNENFCCKYFKEQCKSFLLHVLLHSKDPWSQLYSFIALKQSETNFTQFLLDLITKQENPPFMTCKNKFDHKNELKNTLISRNLAQLQLYLYLNYCLLKNKIDDYHNFSNDDTKIEYYFNNINNTIMLSPSNLMVRNESFEYKTIRYKFSIKPPSFYFEVTILTVGKMSIGLAAKQMDIKKVVGKNSLSIGIDGYNRCLWMHEKAYKFKTFQPEWNAGDVIGIYVDFVNRLVIFGINNKIIEIDGDPFEEEFIFSILPCHVAVSLEHYQQCFFNFNCTDIPDVFLNKQESINQNIQIVNNSILMYGSTATTGNIPINDNSNQFNNWQTLNYNKKLNFIMKSDEVSKRSLQTWSTVTEEINQAYGKILSERYKEDKQISLTACEQWYNQLESILKDIRNPEHSYDKYMRKIGEIYRKLKSDAQKPNPEPSPHNQPLMLMPAPVQLGQNNFSLWLNSLMMALSSDGAGQAVSFPLHEEHPHNLIARGRILLTVPVELQAPIEQLKVAYEMLQVLRNEYEKKDEHSQSSTVNVSKKRTFLHLEKKNFSKVRKRQNQPSTSWAP